MIIDLEDAKAARAFDGPSTELERLRFRAGGLAFDLHDAGEGDADEMIAKAERLLELLRRIKELSSA